MRTVFLQSKYLGMLEGIATGFYGAGESKARRALFNRISRILVDLRVATNKEEIIGLGLGCTPYGHYGLFITLTTEPNETVPYLQGALPHGTLDRS